MGHAGRDAGLGADSGERRVGSHARNWPQRGLGVARGRGGGGGTQVTVPQKLLCGTRSLSAVEGGEAHNLSRCDQGMLHRGGIVSAGRRSERGVKRGPRAGCSLYAGVCWHNVLKPEGDQEVGQNELDALGVRQGCVQAGAGSWGMQLGVKGPFTCRWIWGGQGQHQTGWQGQGMHWGASRGRMGVGQGAATLLCVLPPVLQAGRLDAACCRCWACRQALLRVGRQCRPTQFVYLAPLRSQDSGCEQ